MEEAPAILDSLLVYFYTKYIYLDVTRKCKYVLSPHDTTRLRVLTLLDIYSETDGMFNHDPVNIIHYIVTESFNVAIYYRVIELTSDIGEYWHELAVKMHEFNNSFVTCI